MAEKMKTITKFQSDDGKEFDDEAKCVAHEKLCAEVVLIMASLPALPKDDGCNFSNGHGFIQHQRALFLAVRESLLHIGNRLMPHEWFSSAIANTSAHLSWAARLLDDIGGPVATAWHRIYCTDSDLREWGQPYYAAHPDKGEQICLNAKASS